MNLVEKVFGTHSERELKLIYPIIDKIEKLRPEMQKMSDEELKDQTRKFKERQPERLWMIFFRRPLPPSGKQQKEP